MTEELTTEATAAVEAAIGRLAQRGLVHDDDGTALLNGDGIRTLMDATILWTMHTQGRDVPPDWQLSHDTGMAFLQAVSLCVFEDADDETRSDARRKLVVALRRAARPT